jgi:hypothetical protein
MSVDNPEPIEFIFGVDGVSRRGHAQMASRGSHSLPAVAFDARYEHHGESPEQAAAAGRRFVTRFGILTSQQVLEKAGVVFGEVQKNELFRAVTLPDGWSIKSTTHHMYSDLMDDRGRKRASIMYTAQDHEAWYSVCRRFRADGCQDDIDYSTQSPYIPTILDSNEKTLWRGPLTADGPRDPFTSSPGACARKVAAEKLKEVAPQCDDPTCYWGDDGDALAWPPHETPPDTRERYVLNVQCSSGGWHRDGGDHCSVKAHSDEDALALIENKGGVRGLLSYYDEVRWHVQAVKDGRVVDSGVERRPRNPGRRY